MNIAVVHPLLPDFQPSARIHNTHRTHHQAAAQAGALDLPQLSVPSSLAGLPSRLAEPHTEAAANPQLVQPTQLHRTDRAAAAGWAGESAAVQLLQGVKGIQL
jgi:hypothetical protein